MLKPADAPLPHERFPGALLGPLFETDRLAGQRCLGPLAAGDVHGPDHDAAGRVRSGGERIPASQRLVVVLEGNGHALGHSTAAVLPETRPDECGVDLPKHFAEQTGPVLSHKPFSRPV